MAATDLEALNQALPLGEGVRVVAASNGGLLAIEKPVGIMSHPNEPGIEKRALLQAPYNADRERYDWAPLRPDGPAKLYLLNRLDSPTSGLVLAALNEEAARAGQKAFREGLVKKLYFALVRGTPRPERGLWADQMSPGKPPPRGVRMMARPGGPGGTRGPIRTEVPAQTKYTSMETRTKNGPPLSLLRLEPLTGRTHQLRVQCASHRLPIVGDATYGDFEFNRDFARRTGFKRMFLHSAGLRISVLGFTAESPLPDEFYAALTGQGQPAGSPDAEKEDAG